MLNGTIIWPGGTQKVPLGRPECGFDGELCAPPKKTGLAHLSTVEVRYQNTFNKQ